ncbi:MAG: hypothetical protein ABIT01_19340 [Thermoanaerobaculia bacterium]
MHLDIPIDLLHPVGDDMGAAPESWLHAVLTINGVDHHLEAIAVTDASGAQCAEAPALDDDLGHFLEAGHADRPFDTVRIGSRDYVLVLTPFSAGTLRDPPSDALAITEP